jgi:hypothetical protein
VDFTPGAIICSLVASSIGFALFKYGKREQRWPQLVSGMLLMIGPYFTGGVLTTALFVAAILGGTWAAVRAGW